MSLSGKADIQVDDMIPSLCPWVRNYTTFNKPTG